MSSEAKAALETYVTGGGTILAIGELADSTMTFYNPTITTLNDLATSLDSDVTLQAAVVDFDLYTTTNIDASPLTAGVDSIAYGATSLVNVAANGTGQSLVRTVGGSTFIGVDRIG